MSRDNDILAIPNLQIIFHFCLQMHDLKASAINFSKKC